MTIFAPARASIVYDRRLVEQVVLQEARRLSPAAAEAFHLSRERIYETRDPEDRESQFGAFFEEWFRRLECGRPLEAALAEEPSLVEQTEACRVAGADRGRDEGADLLDLKRDALIDDVRLPPDGGLAPRRIVFVRLRPQSFLDPARLFDLLRHELLHVIDMLDPAFGYERELPAATGPGHDHLLRTRYRVVWDVTIDGRLLRRGRTTPEASERRLPEFCATFSMLGDCARSEFERWLEMARPTHRQLMAFARDPKASPSI